MSDNRTSPNMNQIAVLETVSIRWPVEHASELGPNATSSSQDPYNRTRQLARVGQPSEVVAISYRLLNRYDDLGDYEDPVTVYVKPHHSEVSDVTLDILELTRREFEEESIPFADSAAMLKQAFNPSETLPVWATWGHYPFERLRKDYAKVKAKYPFSSRHINLKTVAGIMLRGQDLPLKDALSSIERDSGLQLPVRGRSHIDNLDSITDIAWYLFCSTWGSDEV